MRVGLHTINKKRSKLNWASGTQSPMWPLGPVIQQSGGACLLSRPGCAKNPPSPAVFPWAPVVALLLDYCCCCGGQQYSCRLLASHFVMQTWRDRTQLFRCCCAWLQWLQPSTRWSATWAWLIRTCTIGTVWALSCFRPTTFHQTTLVAQLLSAAVPRPLSPPLAVSEPAWLVHFVRTTICFFHLSSPLPFHRLSHEGLVGLDLG